MLEFLENILGSYTPVTYDTIIDGVSVSVIPDGLAGVDWLYVLCGFAFLLIVFCFFKLLGGLICRTF